MKLALGLDVSDLPARLAFDAENHEYRYNGRRVPSVTQILEGAGLINTEWFSEEAAWRGSVVHRCCEFDCKGTLKEATVDPGAVGYLEAWRAWKRNVGFTPTIVEQRFFHDTLYYAGTQDRAGTLADGSVCDVDLKTGAAAKWHPLQLVAYANFHPRPRSRRRFTVRLSSDGRYTTNEYTAATWLGDWAAFQGALALHNWRSLNGC